MRFSVSLSKDDYGSRMGTFDAFLLNGVNIMETGTKWDFTDLQIGSWTVTGSVAYDDNGNIFE